MLGYLWHIADYRQFAFRYAWGSNSDQGNFQVSYVFPGPEDSAWFGIQQYGLAWYLQYHDGFDESIISFNQRSQSLRLGVRFDL